MDIRQSPQFAIFLRDLGWDVERIDNVNYFVKTLPLFGSVLKIQRPRTINLDTINKLQKKYRSFQINIEPDISTRQQIEVCNLLQKNGYKINKSPFLPSKTIQINLSKPYSGLLKEMGPTVRRNIKISKRSSITVKISDDIEAFVNFWHLCHKKRLLFLSQAKEIKGLFKTFGKNSKIFLSYKDKEIVAGLLTISYDKIAYYMYAASNSLGKKLFAPTLISWRAIQNAKRTGNKTFDFEGIYDERFPIKSWLGFTKFKKSFGGNEIEYPGCYTKFKLGRATRHENY